MCSSVLIFTEVIMTEWTLTYMSVYSFFVKGTSTVRGGMLCIDSYIFVPCEIPLLSVFSDPR